MADLDSYIFVPTQQSKRFLALSNVRSPLVLNVCEGIVAWYFQIFDFRNLKIKSRNHPQ